MKQLNLKLNKIMASLVTLSVLAPNLTFAQSVSLGAQNNTKQEDTSILINNSELTIKYEKNLNTDIQKFLIPASGKVIVDFFGVLSKDKEEKLISDKIIEKYQTVFDGKRTRLIITVKPSIVEYLKQKNQNLTVDDVIVGQLPNSTKIGFKSHLLFAANEIEKKSLNLFIDNKKTIVEKNINQAIAFENITEEIDSGKKQEEKITSNDNKKISKTVLEKLNFVKLSNASAKLTLDLSRSDNLATIKKADNYLIIELPSTLASEELKKKIDTKQFGLSTKSIDVLQNENSIKIIMEQDGYWEHSMSQTDKKVNIEIKTLSKAQHDKIKEEEFRKGNSNVDKKVTLNFQNMEVRALLQVIADFSNMNVVASDKVAGSMTIKLTEVPWEQALDIILDSKDLTMTRKGNVIWVATREELNQKQKNMLESQTQSYELEQLKLVTFQLNYHKAADVATFLVGGKTSSAVGSVGDAGVIAKTESGDNRILSKRGTVNFDARTNTLFIQDTDQKIQEIARIIKKLDASSRQVLIEAKIVIADDQFSRDLGMKYGFQFGKNKLAVASTSANATNQVNGTTVNIDSDTGYRTVTNPATAVDLSASTGAATLGISFLNQLTGNGLTAELSAMENNNLGKVISSPRLVTFDHQAAKIEQGTEIPYVTPGSSNSPATVSFRKAVLALNVTPQISPNGRVNLKLDIRKDTIGQLINVAGGGTVPSIDTRNITTQVTVKNGQTIVLGGVYESITRDDVRKIPFLGDIPAVGNLFKNSIKENGKAELLIFITPHVVEDTLLDQAPEAEVIDLKKIE